MAAESEMNPQIVYGEDVMSRIQYTIEHADGLEKLHKAIISTLNKLLKQAVKSANASLRAIAKQSRIEGIAEPVPSKARNLRVCFGFASQPLRSSQ